MRSRSRILGRGVLVLVLVLASILSRAFAQHSGGAAGRDPRIYPIISRSAY